MTFAELAARSVAVAHYLADLGLRRGDRLLLVQVGRLGLIPANKRRLMCLSMFWHFLDVIWIGVFTFVYLMGMLR